MRDCLGVVRVDMGCCLVDVFVLLGACLGVVEGGGGEGWCGEGRAAGLLQSPSLILLHPPVGGASRSATIGVAMGARVGMEDGWRIVGGMAG